MLNWISRNRIGFWHWNCVNMLNGIVWNRTAYMCRMDLALMTYNGWCAIKKGQTFCASLLHSLSMWLMVSSLSPHNLHLLFCCVLSIFALI